jgi:hypothetical protein
MTASGGELVLQALQALVSQREGRGHGGGLEGEGEGRGARLVWGCRIRGGRRALGEGAVRGTGGVGVLARAACGRKMRAGHVRCREEGGRARRRASRRRGKGDAASRAGAW